MPQELVYTNAAKGLRPGSQGFCTVAMSRGLSNATVDALEALSANYRSGPRTSPVSISFIKLTLGNKVLAILSRIASIPGPRPNHIAHHILLDPNERPAVGPVWLACQPNLFITAWQEPPRYLSVRPLPTSPTPEPNPPTLWGQLTGNPLWAEALAEVWMLPASQPLYLIAPANFDPLPLIAESIALLPVNRRWQATFTTTYFGLPAEANCQVRVVIAGSEFEALARQQGGWDLATLRQYPPPPANLLRQARGASTTSSAGPAITPSTASPVVAPVTAGPAVAAGTIAPAPTNLASTPRVAGEVASWTPSPNAPATTLPVFDPDAPPLNLLPRRRRNLAGLLFGLLMAIGLSGLAVYCVVLLSKQRELIAAIDAAEKGCKEAEDRAQNTATALAESQALIDKQRNEIKKLNEQLAGGPKGKDKLSKEGSSEPVVFKKVLDMAEEKIKELMEEKTKLEIALADEQKKLKEFKEAKMMEWNKLIFEHTHSVEFVVDISAPVYRKEIKEAQFNEFELPKVLREISSWLFSEAKVDHLLKENINRFDAAKTNDTRTKSSIILCFKTNEKDPSSLPLIKISINETREKVKVEWVLKESSVETLKILDIQNKLADEIGKKYTTVRVPLLQNSKTEDGPALVLRFRSYTKIGNKANPPG